MNRSRIYSNILTRKYFINTESVRIHIYEIHIIFWENSTVFCSIARIPNWCRGSDVGRGTRISPSLVGDSSGGFITPQLRIAHVHNSGHFKTAKQLNELKGHLTTFETENSSRNCGVAATARFISGHRSGKKLSH